MKMKTVKCYWCRNDMEAEEKPPVPMTIMWHMCEKCRKQFKLMFGGKD